MTLSKMASTDSSMGDSVSRKGDAVQSPPAPWLGRLARRWSLAPSYARQHVFADFGCFDRSAEAVEEMLLDGRHDLVALRCAKLDAVRAAYQFTETTTAEHCIRILDSMTSDAMENPATAAHAMQPNKVTWSTARRKLIKEVHDKLELIRSGDMLYAEGRV